MTLIELVLETSIKEAGDYLDVRLDKEEAKYILQQLKNRVNVVRCKDCKKQISCTIYVEAVQEENEDWFCADGVAKDMNVPNKEGR